MRNLIARFLRDEEGQDLVEYVLLVSLIALAVAAAKTWQFQPATRDGHPVRFRTRIRVTL
jgi:Flp pilus assembly pilin Flp